MRHTIPVIHIAIASMLALLLGLPLALSARTPHSWHVFPSVNDEGTRPGGEGTLDKPWDLQTALQCGTKEHPVLPGDTIWLHADKAGNTYWGFWAYDREKRYRPYTYYSQLNGSKDQPIIVKAWPAARPDENHVVIDCTRLMGINNFQALCEGRGAEKSNGKYRLPNNFNSDMISVLGSYTWFWGLEVRGSDLHREDFEEMGNRLKGGVGINILSKGDGNNTGNKIINCVIHDIDGIGVASWASTENPEVYGNLIYYNGTKVGENGKPIKRIGNGVYAQNADICSGDTLHHPSRSVYRDNFIFENYNNNFHINASGQMSKMDAFTIDGNVAFNSGLLSDSFGNINYVQYSGMIQKDYIITNNHFCFFSDILPTELFAIGKEVSTFTLDNRIERNHFIVACGKYSKWWAVQAPSVSMQNVTGTSFRRNFVRHGQVGLFIQNKSAFDNLSYPGTMTLSSDSNTFVYDSVINGEVSTMNVFNSFCKKTSASTLYNLDGNTRKYPYNRSSWRAATQQDMHSKEIHGIKNPAVNQLEIIKTPNAYDPGRMHLVIYNWSNHLSTPLDMDTILPKGSTYRIRDVQNYYGADIAAGTYNGAINLPLNNTKVVQPIGLGDKSNRYVTKVKHTNDMEYAGDKYMFNTLIVEYFPYQVKLQASGVLCKKDNKNEIKLTATYYNAKGRKAETKSIVLRKEWKRNGKIISDATGNELKVNTPGTYTLTVTYENGQSHTEQITVEECK